MLFSKINLKTELIRERKSQQKLLDEVHDILKESIKKDEDVLDRLRQTGSGALTLNTFSKEEQEKIFNLEEIKNICIRYRLRFLNSKYFKSDYPYAAISAIHALEKRHSIKIKQYYIAAPDHTFNLENVNKDPLLFARMENGEFYLIHQWGKDLAWHKKYTLWALQSFRNCFLALWLVAATLSFLIPSSVMRISSFEGEIYLRLWLMVHVFIALFGFTVWIGFTFNKTASNKNWNSKYYND